MPAERAYIRLVNPVDTVPLMLFALHLLALGVGMVMFFGMLILHRRARALAQTAQADHTLFSADSRFVRHPTVWLAIHSSNSRAVQNALGVGYPAPCPWAEGIAGGHDFFIGSPVNEWIIVTGSGLPHPGKDVDRCYHFLILLSRVLGQVQFFMADPVLHHHAWVRVENGTVTRAYAWVNETLWNQGAKSIAEIELNMKCFSYGENAGMDDATMAEYAAANVKKIPSLSARWSFDPINVNLSLQHPAPGVAGKSSRPW
ncbi:MAG TPA: hypothetical protein VMA35_06390 [Candidatus Sulfopaludibacter sp.]|nr:hypothetical protein [Candidatus Sulfopaludibacter sp.]